MQLKLFVYYDELNTLSEQFFTINRFENENQLVFNCSQNIF
jgi:hypothetical protein